MFSRYIAVRFTDLVWSADAESCLAPALGSCSLLLTSPHSQPPLPRMSLLALAAGLGARGSARGNSFNLPLRSGSGSSVCQ